MSTKYLDEDGAILLNQLLATKFNSKVDSNSLATVATSGSYNDLSNQPTIPTNNNQLTNGAGYQTASDVSTAINTAIGQIAQIDYQVVTSLPATGVKGTIYLVSNSGSGTNVYDEYIWVNNAWEKIGTTAVDISGKEDKSNKVTSISSSSTDTQYPSAKLLYDQLALKANTSSLPTKTGDLTNNGTGTSTQGLVYAVTETNNSGVSVTVSNNVPTMKPIFADVILNYPTEFTNNKVTSISSSSTNTQYPSAKLLYDKLATKQDTMTALTNAEVTSIFTFTTST